MQVQRRQIYDSLRGALDRAPIVVLVGPRQSGKTTLAREWLSEQSPNYFDLEDPVSLARLSEPMTALGPLRDLVVIDEIQRRPDLFPVLRVLADRKPCPARFLILGSASGELMRQSAESLAGRVERLMIGGFTLSEVGADATATLWRRGGFPRAHLARTEDESVAWRRQFILTLLERDLPQWGIRTPAATLQRFWTLIAHYHAQIWNATEPARTLGVSAPTCRRYLDLLADAQMIRKLEPWHANLKKRQVKAPKVYVRDSGLLHQLLGIEDERALQNHPKLGASWEGFALEQILMTESHDGAWFWGTHQGAEIDLLLRRGERFYGIEIKRMDAPRMTPSLHSALEDLELERIAIVYPGSTRYAIHDRVEVVPISTLASPGALLDG